MPVDSDGDIQYLSMKLTDGSSKRLPIASDPQKKSLQYVRVKKTEEKGSDVNLAVNLVADGYKGLFDVAVLITNDSDLLAPIKVVKGELGKTVGVIFPGDNNQSKELSRWASFKKTLLDVHLKESLFSPTLLDKDGRTITKPSSW
jgi:uncharacterized LabA/DUF88 family protein